MTDEQLDRAVHEMARAEAPGDLAARVRSRLDEPRRVLGWHQPRVAFAVVLLLCVGAAFYWQTNPVKPQDHVAQRSEPAAPVVTYNTEPARPMPPSPVPALRPRERERRRGRPAESADHDRALAAIEQPASLNPPSLSQGALEVGDLSVPALSPIESLTLTEDAETAGMGEFR